MRKSSYSNDPKWMTAKFGNCKECGTSLRGKQMFYYPKTKECFCETCGDKHSRDFESCRQDEDNYNSYYGRY